MNSGRTVYAVRLLLAMIPFLEVKRIGKELSINEQIRAREVRVVSDTNEQLGIMTLHEAIRIAEDKGLDLVEVAPNGRHRYAVS